MIFPEISAHQLHHLTIENLLKNHPKCIDVHKNHRFRYAVSSIYLRRVDFLCTNIDWNLMKNHRFWYGFYCSYLRRVDFFRIKNFMDIAWDFDEK